MAFMYYVKVDMRVCDAFENVCIECIECFSYDLKALCYTTMYLVSCMFPLLFVPSPESSYSVEVI